MEQIKKISINETEYQIIDETALHEGDIPTNVSAFTNDAGYLTEHQSLDGLATEDYVQDQIATIQTPDVSGQINTHNQNTTAHSDIRTAIDELENAIDGIAIPTALSELTADATHRLVTDTEKSTWNAKANASDIPSKTSDLTNDSGFATESYVNTQVSNLVNSAPDKLNTLDELASALGDDANFANTVTTELSKKANSADLGSLAKKSTVDKSDLSSSVQTSLNKADSALQSYTETDPTVPAWAKASTKPSYTKSEVGLGNVDNVKQYSASNPPPYPVTKVNNKTGAVTLTASDVGADASGTANSAINSHNTSTSAHADIREAINQLSSEKVDISSVTQLAGKSEKLVMSQKAVTELVSNALDSMGGGGNTITYDTVDSIEEMTDTSKQYILSSTGTLWEYDETEVDDTNRNLYDASKVIINANPDGSERNGAFSTDYIPVDVNYASPYNMRIVGLAETNGTLPDLYKIAYYDASKTQLGIEYGTTTVKTQNGNRDYSYQIGYKTDSGKATYFASIAYVKLLCRASSTTITQDNVPADLTITTPEPKTITNVAWCDTGVIPENASDGGDNYVDLLVKINQNTTDIVEISDRVAALESGDSTTEYETVNSVEEMTDTSKQYVLSSTNTLWTYGETTVDDTDRNLFDASKVTLNQNVDGSKRDGTFLSDYIPVDVSYSNPYNITIVGLKPVSDGNTFPSLYKASYYDSNKNIIGNELYFNSLSTTALSDVDGFTWDVGSGITNRDSIAYVRLLCYVAYGEYGAITQAQVSPLVITTPEPKTKIENGWYDTGLSPEEAGDDNYVDLLVKVNKNTADIAEVSNRVTALETKGNVVTIPDYWKDATNAVVSTVKARQNAGGKDIVNFAWFSDFHYDGVTKDYIGNIGNLCAYIMDKCDIPLALMNGDTLTAGVLPTDAAVLNALNGAMELYAPIGTDRLMLVRGNHDDVYGSSSSASYVNKVAPAKMWNSLHRPQAKDFRRVFGEDGTYFYLDNVPQKVRFICLNSHLYDGEAITNGTVSAMTTGFGAAQLEWLENTALDVEDGWGVVITLHAPPIADFASQFSGTNYADFRSIITSSTADIIGIFCGHAHKDRVITSDLPCPVCVITCATNTPYDGTAEERTNAKGTDKETALDIVSIDKASRKIYMTRLGAGSNRETSY